MSNFDYYNFQINTVVEKINEEIEFYEKCEFVSCYPISSYLEYLKKRIGLNNTQEPVAIMHYDNSGNKREIKKMNLDEYGKDMDMYVFKRQWNKLREYHKIMKIREYIDGLEYGKKAKEKHIAKNNKYLKDEICAGLRTKKFGKNKSEIVYDKEQMCIRSISSVYYNKKTGLYEIDWDL